MARLQVLLTAVSSASGSHQRSRSHPHILPHVPRASEVPRSSREEVGGRSLQFQPASAAADELVEHVCSLRVMRSVVRSVQQYLDDKKRYIVMLRYEKRECLPIVLADSGGDCRRQVKVEAREEGRDNRCLEMCALVARNLVTPRVTADVHALLHRAERRLEVLLADLLVVPLLRAARQMRLDLVTVAIELLWRTRRGRAKHAALEVHALQSLRVLRHDGLHAGLDDWRNLERSLGTSPAGASTETASEKCSAIRKTEG